MRKIFYFYLFSLILILSGPSSFAQLRDDSTRQVYGTHSTVYYLEEDIINNRKSGNKLDTTLNGFHNYGGMYLGEVVYQNLGNFATPIAPIYFQTPIQIGKTLGLNSTNYYAVDPTKVRYHDTRSPYSSVYYVQGSRGQQILEAELSRNVNKQWNLGLDVRSITSRQLIGQSTNTSANNATKQASFTSVILSTRYFTKNERYQLLSNITTLDGKMRENGGVVSDPTLTNPDSIYTNYFDPLVRTNLYSARNLERRFNYHLYQQFTPFKIQAIQLYNIFDYYTRSNRYTDAINTYDSTFYQNNFAKQIVQARKGVYDVNATNDQTQYRLLENKLGVKGSAGILKYRAYWRFRNLYYTQAYQLGTFSVNPFSQNFTENYLGGSGKITFSDSSSIDASAELYINGSNRLNDYFLRADYTGKLLFGGINSTRYSPSLVQLKYISNHVSWSNGFSSTLSNNVYGGIRCKIGDLEIKPTVNYYLLSNYVYYDTIAKPEQTSKTINILYGNLFLRYRLRNFYLENIVRYTNISGPGKEFIKMPELYNHTRIYHQNHFFEKNLHLQVGLDVFYKSAYYANYYFPVTKQFYLNNSFLVKSYWLADFFMNFQVKKVNIFLKVSNVALGVFPKPGYFTTPYYPGMKRSFEFGIKWMFFN